MDKVGTGRMLLGVEEVAANLPGGSVSTVRHWIATGQLRSRKIGKRQLVHRDEVARFLGLDPREVFIPTGEP